MALNTGQASIEITAVDKTRQAFDSLKASFSSIARQYASLGTLLSGGAFATMISNAIDAADAMNDLSKRTGISVERLGAWKLITEQTGTSLESLAVALGRGSKYMVEHGDNLRKLGINAKTSEELVLQLSGVISRLPADDPRRVALAMEVLGKSAGDLLPLLAEGEAGLRRMRERGEELNPITQEMADKADKFNDQLAELKIQAGGVAFIIAGPLLDGFTNLIGRIQQITSETSLLKQAFESVKLVAEYAYKPLLGPLGMLMGGDAKASTGGASGSWGDPASSGAVDQKTLKVIDDIIKPAGSKTRKSTVGPNLYKEHMEDVAKLIQGINELSTSEMTEVEILQQKLGAYTNLDPALKKYLQGVLTQTEAEEVQHERVTYAVQQTIKAYQEQQAALQAYEGDWRDYLGGLEDNLVALRQENELYGLTATQVAEVNLRRAEETAEIARRNGVSQDYLYRLEREVELRRELLKETASAEEKRAWKDIFDNIERTAHDTFVSIFDSGKSAFNRLKDALKNGLLDLLYQMTIKKWIINISAAVTGSAAGSAAAGILPGESGGIPGGGGFDGMIGAIKTGWDIFKNGLDATNIAFEQAIQTLGTKIVDFGFEKLGGMISQNSGMIAQALPYTASVFKLLSGDFKGAAFTAAGTAIGQMFGGPAGAAIGSFIGSAVGDLFGGDHKNPRAATRNRLFEDGTYKEVMTYSKDGGKVGPARDLVKAFTDSFKMTMDELGVELKRSIVLGGAYNTDSGSYFMYSLGDKSSDKALAKSARVKNQKDLGNAAAWVQLEALLNEDLLPEWLDKLATSLDRVTKKGEENLAFVVNIKKLHDALGELPPEFQKVQRAMEAMVTKDNVANFQALTAGVANFYSLFYTQEEKFAFMQNQLRDQFDDLNFVLPQTREGYRALVESIDVSSKAGLDLYSTLIMLAPTMDGYYNALQEQAGAVDAVTGSIEDMLAVLDPNKFSMLVDYRRAQAYIRNGVTLPSFDIGTNYVPRDMTANIHAGERIVPAADNRELMARLRDPQGNTAALLAAMNALRDEIRAGNVSIAQATQKTAKILQRFDDEGIVLSETERDGTTRVVLDTRAV